jgi:hypothetical protein
MIRDEYSLREINAALMKYGLLSRKPPAHYRSTESQRSAWRAVYRASQRKGRKAALAAKFGNEIT